MVKIIELSEIIKKSILKYGLFGEYYRVAKLSTGWYLTVTGIIILTFYNI